MKNYKLYYIEDEYINYLRLYDTKVLYNKNQSRPYVGIVCTFKGYNYFIPLSSPKPKHKKMNEKALDIFKISKGNLGIANINNMIPAPIETLTEVLSTINDEKYKILLEKQITYINDHKVTFENKIHNFYSLYQKGHLSDAILKRSCDFSLLELKCKEYCENAEILDLTKDTGRTK